eukprot:COSAG02_NODE_220_length_28426_cov_28.546863_26_plen_110_part_00
MQNAWVHAAAACGMRRYGVRAGSVSRGRRIRYALDLVEARGPRGGDGPRKLDASAPQWRCGLAGLSEKQTGCICGLSRPATTSSERSESSCAFIKGRSAELAVATAGTH